MASTRQNDDAALLALLASHGQQFIRSFGDSAFVQGSSKTKRKLNSDVEANSESESERGDTSDEDNHEWHGFGNENDTEAMDTDAEEIEDDDFTSDIPALNQPETVVFEASRSTESSSRMSKAQVKSFMSSKVTKLRDQDGAQITPKLSSNQTDHDDERTNLENDALLHKLIHTQLLSARSTDLNVKSAERKRVVQGRVLELAAGAKLGSGEKAVRLEEQKRASKKIRLGLERKASEREAQALEEAKNLGNYHKSIKHLYNPQSKKQMDRRKRDKGLKMGIGHFSQGVLKLSKKDISSGAGFGSKNRKMHERR